MQSQLLIPDLGRDLDLSNTSYPELILGAAGDVLPGRIVSWRQALEAAVRISAAAPNLTVDAAWARGGKLRAGPFGAVQMAVNPRAAIRLFYYDLRGATPDDAIDVLLNLELTVVGLGWNNVNQTHSGTLRPSAPHSHAEMTAGADRCRVVRFPPETWAGGTSVPTSWASNGIMFVEAASSQNCVMCHGTNGQWLATIASLFAANGEDVGRCTGFREGAQALPTASLVERWMHIPTLDAEGRPPFDEMTAEFWAADPEFRVPALAALRNFVDPDGCNAAVYQADYALHYAAVHAERGGAAT